MNKHLFLRDLLEVDIGVRCYRAQILQLHTKKQKEEAGVEPILKTITRARVRAFGEVLKTERLEDEVAQVAQDLAKGVPVLVVSSVHVMSQPTVLYTCRMLPVFTATGDGMCETLLQTNKVTLDQQGVSILQLRATGVFEVSRLTFPHVEHEDGRPNKRAQLQEILRSFPFVLRAIATYAQERNVSHWVALNTVQYLNHVLSRVCKKHSVCVKDAGWSAFAEPFYKRTHGVAGGVWLEPTLYHANTVATSMDRILSLQNEAEKETVCAW